MARTTIGITPGSGSTLDGYDNASDGFTRQAVTIEPTTGGGATSYSLINTAAANQDSSQIKASAGTLYSIDISNANAAVRFLKIYDKATAPTSADTPVRRYRILASQGSTRFDFPLGLKFSSGIAFRITVNQVDNDANAATATDHIVNAIYA